MTRSIKAEVLKLITMPGTYGLFVGAIAVVALTVGSTIMSAKASTLSGDLHEQVFFLLTAINVGLFSLILGMKVITDEYRNGTILHAFLSDPRRVRTVIAKGLAAAISASLLAAVSLGALTAMAATLAAAKGGSLGFGAADVSAYAGFLISNALWAVLGVAVGSIVRHQVASIVGGLIWVLIIENLGSGFLGEAGRYLPGQTAYALADALDTTNALGASTAGIVMALYATVAIFAAAVVTRARDVA